MVYSQQNTEWFKNAVTTLLCAPKFLLRRINEGEVLFWDHPAAIQEKEQHKH